MLYILNLILGYVEVEIQSPYTERVLNMLSVKGIAFWNLNYLEYGKITLCIHAKNFFKLRPIARRTTSKVKIISKRGLPFFMQKFKGRCALFAGILLFCTIMWVLTNFVWVIDISGGDHKLHADILTQLSYNGLKVGAYSHKINHDELKNDVLLNFPELSNITVNISGSHAKVTIYMKSPPPEITDYSLHSNIISDYDGIITSITVTSGTPEVSPGDTVMRGQLLASGYMTGRTGTTVNYRAIAKINARTWDRKNIVIPKNTNKKEFSGSEKNKYTVILGKKRINLYFGTGNSYDTCDKIIKRVQLTLPFGLKLPIFLETCTLKEYSLSEYTVSDDEASKFLTENAKKYVTLNGDDRILNEAFELKSSDGRYTLNYTAECERSIGVEQMIPKGE